MRKPQHAPPSSVWVSYCGRCGEPWGASRTKREAEHYSGGCDCSDAAEVIAVARFLPASHDVMAVMKDATRKAKRAAAKLSAMGRKA